MWAGGHSSSEGKAECWHVMLADHVPSSCPEFVLPILAWSPRFEAKSASVRAILLGFPIFEIIGSSAFYPPEKPVSLGRSGEDGRRHCKERFMPTLAC